MRRTRRNLASAVFSFSWSAKVYSLMCCFFIVSTSVPWSHIGHIIEFCLNLILYVGLIERHWESNVTVKQFSWNLYRNWNNLVNNSIILIISSVTNTKLIFSLLKTLYVFQILSILLKILIHLFSKENSKKEFSRAWKLI